MKLEQQLLINREWSSNNNYWSTGMKLETTIDQEGMIEQQLLINREWIRAAITDQRGMKV